MVRSPRPRALYHRRGDQPDGWVRIGWEEIETARWLPADQTLNLTALPGSERPPISLYLNGPGQLPAVCQDRISATVIATRRVTLPSSLAVITVRRQPGTDALVWTVRLRDRPQADTDRQVDHAIRALRADLGI